MAVTYDECYNFFKKMGLNVEAYDERVEPAWDKTLEVAKECRPMVVRLDHGYVDNYLLLEFNSDSDELIAVGLEC
jgi:hypothetical protein